MKKILLLSFLLIACVAVSYAQDVFSGKTWGCVKRSQKEFNDLSSARVIKTFTDSNPMLQFTIKFSEIGGSQIYTRYDCDISNTKTSGSYRYNNDGSLTLIEDGGKAALIYKITKCGNENFLILECFTKGDIWYMVRQ